MKNYLEHANITVSDAQQTAEILCRLFDWTVRWSGDAISGGYSVHVGSDDSYIALYTQSGTRATTIDTYKTAGALNHLGIVVEDLDVIEKRVMDAGYQPHSHADYEPGKRFYFDLPEGLEIEVVNYSVGI